MCCRWCCCCRFISSRERTTWTESCLSFGPPSWPRSWWSSLHTIRPVRPVEAAGPQLWRVAHHRDARWRLEIGLKSRRQTFHCEYWRIVDISSDLFMFILIEFHIHSKENKLRFMCICSFVYPTCSGCGNRVFAPHFVRYSWRMLPLTSCAESFMSVNSRDSSHCVS